MDRKYTVAEMEGKGVEATGTFYGTPRKGWIMNGVDFVDYAGYAQLVMPVADAVDLKVEDWTQGTPGRKYLRAVIRFKRAIKFPRFSMALGEKWGLSLYKENINTLKAIEAGEPFEFAGGQCLPSDVEVVYIGQAGIEYTRAQGIHVP